jgi:hypothetical protein
LGLTLKEQQNSLQLPIERECVWRINESWQSCLLLHAWGITFGRSWFTVESALAFCCYMFCVLQSNIMWSSHTNYLEVYWIASNSNYLLVQVTKKRRVPARNIIKQVTNSPWEKQKAHSL